MQAVIMAGGQGTRLGPYSAVLPKPLVPIGEMPILELLLRQFKQAGVTQVILAVNHLHHLMRAFFGNGERWGIEISYSLEAEPLGTAGPLGAVLEQLDDTFLVSNGDLLTSLDFKEMIASHLRAGADATIGSASREVKSDFGVLQTDDRMKLVGYLEKPVQKHLVSMGLYALQRQAVAKHLSPGVRMDMPDLMLSLVRDGRLVHCHVPECYWLDIGRPADYALAQEIFAKDRTMFLKAGI